MPEADPQVLIRRVAFRQGLAEFGVKLYALLLAVAVFDAALLIAARVFALFPDSYVWWGFALSGVVALLGGSLLRSSPTLSHAAHLIDTAMDTDDLFLTAQQPVDPSHPYMAIVLRQAQEAAESIRPSAVVRYMWQRRASHLASVFLALGLVGLYLPRFDPFGKDAARERSVARKRELGESARATAIRKNALVARDPAKEHSGQVDQALEGLLKTFEQMRPEARQANMQKLQQGQQELGKLWRKLSEAKLRSAVQRADVNQRFGAGMNMPKTSRWQEQLQRGDASGIRQELRELQDLLEQMRSKFDDAERRKLAREFRQRAKDLADFAAEQFGNTPLDDALARALEQLAMTEDAELAADAAKAAAESLNLAAAEMAALAQAIRDLQALEEAMNAAQLAKQLNEMAGLKGMVEGDPQSIADYAQLYAQMMAEAQGRGEGEGGPGMKGEGTGKGGLAPEADEEITGHKSEKSKSAITAGKMLLQWQSRGVSGPGDAPEPYEGGFRRVQQGVSEAIILEKAPPGYHDSIKRYFDIMGKEANIGGASGSL